MILICCKCKRILGEKEPFENKSITHGYCDPCLQEALAEIGVTEQEIKEVEVIE